MNIFYTNPDPRACAQEHNNRHVVKMILEYAQLLSTAHRILDGYPAKVEASNGRAYERWVHPIPHLDEFLYLSVHPKHPSAIWCRENISNYMWLAMLLREVSTEYTHRYGKVHATESKGLVSFLLARPPANIPSGEFFPPYLAMPEEYKDQSKVIESYIRYILADKQHILQWKDREPPQWARIFLASRPETYVTST